MKKKESVFSSSKGQILTSTIVTALIVVIIAAGLMRLVLMRYMAANRVTQEVKYARCVQMATAQFFSTWDRLTTGTSGVTDPVCSSVPGLFKCTGSTHGHCRCHCTFTSGALSGLTVRVTNGPNPPNPPCTFTAQTMTNTSSPFASVTPVCQ